MGENNKANEDIVQDFWPSQMNSMLNDETTGSINNNHNGIRIFNIMTKITYGKKKEQLSFILI